MTWGRAGRPKWCSSLLLSLSLLLVLFGLLPPTLPAALSLLAASCVARAACSLAWRTRQLRTHRALHLRDQSVVWDRLSGLVVLHRLGVAAEL